MKAMWFKGNRLLLSVTIAAALAAAACGSDAARQDTTPDEAAPGETKTVTLTVQGMT